MNWNKLKKEIYYVDGSLRDIYIKNTDIEDNKKWIKYVNKNYEIKCFNATLKDENKINLNAVFNYFNENCDICITARLFIGKIQINNHFFCLSEIENDIDPKEINSLEDHNKIIEYMKAISTLLDKPVILTPDNTPETSLIKVVKDKVSYSDNEYTT